jgi:hypothetical protein
MKTPADDISLIESKKIELISILTKVYNLDLLFEIEKLILSTQKDWWTSISVADQKAIDEGIEDVRKGNLVSHKQATDTTNNRKTAYNYDIFGKVVGKSPKRLFANY